MNVVVASVDLRSLFGPSRNQGSRPTCLAFAASDAHAALRGRWTPLSCEYAFYHAQRRANRAPSDGALLSSMLDALRIDGQPAESGWPYLATTPIVAASWSPPDAVGPLFGRAGGKFSPTIEDIIAELDRGRPVITLTMLSRSFYRPSPQAVIHPENGEAPEPARRHAVVAVGHGRVGSHRAILARNSWGPQWGDHGYGWLTETFLGPRIFAAAVLTEEVDVSARSAAA